METKRVAIGELEFPALLFVVLQIAEKNGPISCSGTDGMIEGRMLSIVERHHPDGYVEVPVGLLEGQS